MLYSGKKKRNWVIWFVLLTLAFILAACGCGCGGACPPPTPVPAPPSSAPEVSPTRATITPVPTTQPAVTSSGTATQPVDQPEGSDCENEECTATPGPAPSVTKTIFFGGSNGESLVPPGPDPHSTTKVWAESATKVVPFPGGGAEAKKNQANNVDINTYKEVNLILIGYSAGGDTALIFADKYRKYQQTNNGGTGKITDVAVLGGTMSGKMTDTGTLADTWRDVLNNLLLWETDIYILNDDANYGDEAKGYVKPAGATGTFYYDDRPNQSHTNGTNNSESYKNEVYSWFDAH